MKYVTKGPIPKYGRDHSTRSDSHDSDDSLFAKNGKGQARDKKFGKNFFKNLPVKYFKPQMLTQINQDVINDQFN